MTGVQTCALPISRLTAYDAATGKVRWTAKQQTQSGGGYSTPVIYRPKSGTAQIIVYGAGETAGYQVSTGERIWSARGFTAQPAASPIVSGDMLYVLSPKEAPMPWSEVAEFDTNRDGRIPIAAIPRDKPVNVAWGRLLGSMEQRFGDGDGVLTRAEFEKASAGVSRGGGLLALPLAGKGDLGGAVKWRAEKSIPYFASPLLYRGVLYTIRQGGILFSYDPGTGKVHKQGRIPESAADYWASPVAAAGRLYFVNTDGKLSALKAGAQWEHMASVELGEPVFATPALSGGRLYVRGAKNLYCFGK